MEREVTGTAPGRPDPGAFGPLLRARRRAVGLTQEALAERAGLSARGIQHLEAGDTRPYPATVDALAGALGLDAGAAAALRASLERPPAAGGRPRSAAPAGLPAELTSFVGRERELAEARRLLSGDPSGARLLTLTGPGGAGKTRLALRLAAVVAPAFPDGVRFVPLAALADPALVPAAVARSLGVQDGAGRPLEEALEEALRTRRLLLVLDTVEHLLPAAPLVPRLLAAAPGLTVVATSRAPLRVPGEQLFPVPPLAVPPLGPGADPAAVARSEAVRLFVERARAARPDFRLTPDDAEAVAEVCRRLDGLPLALELAAARVRVLSADQIAARLGDRFRLLTGGSQVAPPHQQTLRATVAWSHDLLAEPERVLFRRLAVFAGGFSLEAAEAVCGWGGAAGDGAAGDAVAPEGVLDLLSLLVDRSLVVAEAPAGGGALRYRLLDTLREYAAERLGACGEAPAARDRHLAWCVALAERAWTELLGPQQPAWLDRLDTELDNVRAALAWSVDGGRAAAGLRLAGALGAFWGLRGPRYEARRWLEALLAAGPAAPPPVRARALLVAGAMSRFLGDVARASALQQQSLELYRELGDQRGVASALTELASWGPGESVERRRAWAVEAVAAARQAGEPADVARALLAQGHAALDAGELGPAAAHLEESLALYRSIDNLWGTARAQGSLAEVALQRGDLPRAAALYEARLALSRRLRDRVAAGAALSGLAALARRAGDLARAGALYRESLALIQEVGQPLATVECLEGLAGVSVAEGHPTRAARLLAAADAQRPSLGAPLTPAARIERQREVAALRAQLGDVAYAAAVAEGQTLTLDQAVAAALEGP